MSDKINQIVEELIDRLGLVLVNLNKELLPFNKNPLTQALGNLHILMSHDLG